MDDFLEWEAQQPERYEFVDGMILGMVGGSVAYATIRDNVTRCAARPAAWLGLPRAQPGGQGRRRLATSTIPT